jgi:hypothetical protein
MPFDAALTAARRGVDGRSTSSHSDLSVIEFQPLVWSSGRSSG